MESPQPGRDEQAPYPSPFGADAVRQDAFTQGLLERLPEHLSDSFSDEQLEALRGIFGTRSWVRHRLDLRGTLKKAGFITRDSRIKERKKYGKKAARASFQFSKR